MGNRALVAALVVGLFGACGAHEVIPPGAPHPSLVGTSYDVETKSGYRFEGSVMEARPNGDLVVAVPQMLTIPRGDLHRLSRTSRARGFLYGFLTTVGISSAIGALGAASLDKDHCDFACRSAGDRFLAGFSIGISLGLIVGGPLGAAIGVPQEYTYE